MLMLLWMLPPRFGHSEGAGRSWKTGFLPDVNSSHSANVYQTMSSLG